MNRETGVAMRKMLAIAGLTAVAVLRGSVALAQTTSAPTEDAITKIVDFRARLLRAEEVNLDALRDFVFYKGMGGICLFNIDNLEENMAEALGRIEARLNETATGLRAEATDLKPWGSRP
jgi:hypothetical protein